MVPVTLVAVAALVGAACGSPPTRSGQAVDPVALTSVSSGAGGVGPDVLAQLVEDTKADPVQVGEPTRADYSNDVEGDTIKAVQDGTFDIAVVRAGRLAQAGATSLAILQTPFLVTSNEQADAVSADPVADDLMAGLDDIGLTGIALVPGGLRHPFGYSRALYGPDDYRGTVINTIYGSGAEPTLAALGATADNSVDTERADKARSGELRGIEVSLQQQAAADRPAVVTSNVTFYEKFDVVVVRSDTWNGLTSAQQDALRAAAVAAGRTAISARDTEAAGLERWCRTPGAASVVADDDQLAALHTALQSVIDDALALPGAAAIADRVSALAPDQPPPSGATCGSLDADGNVTSGEDAEAANEYEVTRTGPQDVLDGVWRMVADRQQMLDAGISPQDAGANDGVWTLTIVDHIADVEQPNGGPNCTWDFAFDGNRVSLDQSAQGNDNCGGRSIGTYRLDGDIVTFDWERNRDYDVVLDQVMFGHGMQKIG
jgi:TRAP-type C4-dicarboxylate transport system substrate-binding protein